MQVSSFRKISAAAGALGLLLAAVGIGLPFLYGPGEGEFLHGLGGGYLAMTLLGASAAIAGMLSLVFAGTVQRHMSWQTSLLALALSAVGSAGLYCLAVWISFAAFGEIRRYPLEYTGSITGGMVCLFLCFLLLFFYIHFRQKCPSVKGILLDFGLVLLFFFPFLSVWNWLYTLAAY